MKQMVLNNLKKSLKQVKMMREGKLEKQSAKEFLKYYSILKTDITQSYMQPMNRFKKVMKNSPDYQTVIKSQKDSEIFFNSIVNAAEPNADLITAVHRYNEL